MVKLKNLKDKNQNNHQLKKTNYLEVLTEKCLIDILNCVDRISDLLSLRLVNRRFNATIQRNYRNLVKLNLNSLCLIGTPSGKIIRYKVGILKSRDDSSRFFSELSVIDLSNSLRHILTNKLVIEYLNISDELLYQLQKCMKSRRINCFELKHCDLPTNLDSFRLFVSVIREFFVTHFSIFDCRNQQITTKTLSLPSNYVPQTAIICETNFDLIFRLNPQLKSITIAFYNLVEKAELKLTDNTLNYWTQSENWPNCLILANVHTLLTIPSIFRLIYQVMSKDPGTNLFWNLGIIYGFNGLKQYKGNSNNYIFEYLSKFEEFQSARKFLYKFYNSTYKKEPLNDFATFIIISFRSFSKNTRLNLRFHIIFPKVLNSP